MSSNLPAVRVYDRDDTMLYEDGAWTITDDGLPVLPEPWESAVDWDDVQWDDGFVLTLREGVKRPCTCPAGYDLPAFDHDRGCPRRSI